MEWARLEPRHDVRDDAALGHYVAVLSAARDAGLSTVVVLCDAAWPSWLGTEPWLAAWAPPRFAAHAAHVAERLDGLVRAIVTFRAPNAAARAGWRLGARPPFRTGAAARRALRDRRHARRPPARRRGDRDQGAARRGRASLLEAGLDYDDECAWRDQRAGITDPDDVAARRDDYARQVAGSARRRVRGVAARATTTSLRSTPGWRLTPDAQWWLSSDDAGLLARAVRHGAGDVSGVELRAGVAGWDAQLAAGVPAVRAALGDTGVAHLCGLVAATGPLEERPGLLEVDLHGVGVVARDPGGRVAARLAALLT